MAHPPGSGDPVDHSPGSSELPEPTTPSVMARVISSARTSVTHWGTQTLEYWLHVTHILLNLAQLLVSFLKNSLHARTILVMRLHTEHLIRVLITGMIFLANLVRVRALRWAGCENRTQAPSTTSCDPSRISWNLKALLRERLIMFTRAIIVVWLNIKVMVKVMIQLFCIFNVFQTFMQALMWNTFFKYNVQNSVVKQTSMLLSLNQEIRNIIFAKLPLIDVIRLQAICKDFNKVMTSDTFKAAQKVNEGSFGPNVFYLENNMTYMTWRWMSYDLTCQQWKKMPSFSSLPLPDIELFKDFFVAGGGGLFCIDVGKGALEELIVYQPLTKQQKILPQLIHQRRPVLIHIFVEEVSNSYKIIVAGCATSGNKNLSQKTEVYDSCTNCWNESDDIPGPKFALNDYQTGVYVKSLKTLFCIGFLPEDKGRGILAYNVAKGVWIKNFICQLPQNFLYNNNRVQIQITIAQLLEYNNQVFLFSEQEFGQKVTHTIHKLQELGQFEILDDDDDNDDGGKKKKKIEIVWERILCESQNGIHGLLVYPEFECLAHGKDKFCIFNTIKRTGAIYNLHYKNGIYTFDKEKILFFPRLKEDSLSFHTLNPLGFIFNPTFKVSL